MPSLRVYEGKSANCSAQYLYSSWSQASGFSHGNWTVTSLNGKEQEMVREAEQYRLNIVAVSSTKCRGSDAVELNEGWKLFYSGVDVTMSAQEGLGILVNLAGPLWH